jgi:hypothetical protein
MSQLSRLSRALKKSYDSEKGKISATLEREIELNSLVINDLEVHPDEVSSICRFLACKEVIIYPVFILKKGIDGIDTLILTSKVFI